MAETFAALLFAHVLADFVLQTGRMAAAKRRRDHRALARHGAVVFLTSALALGSLTPGGAIAALLPLVLLTAAHLGLDYAKGTLAPATGPEGLGPFLADQALHLVSLALVAGLWPGLWTRGAFAALPWLPPAMALTAGAILATRAGGFAVGLLMARFPASELPEGLPEGGRMIGLLERGMIFLLVIVGQPAGIGFLIAAKSVLRFDAAKETARAGEYVIIGTLASFGWALIAGYATRALAVTLGFPPLVP